MFSAPIFLYFRRINHGYRPVYKWKNPQPTAFLSAAPLDSGGHAEILRDLESQDTHSSVPLRSKKSTQAVMLDNKTVKGQAERSLEKFRDIIGHEEAVIQWDANLSFSLSLFFGRVSLCSPGWSQTCEPLCISLVLGWPIYSFMCATVLSVVTIFWSRKESKI